MKHLKQITLCVLISTGYVIYSLPEGPEKITETFSNKVIAHESGTAVPKEIQEHIEVLKNKQIQQNPPSVKSSQAQPESGMSLYEDDGSNDPVLVEKDEHGFFVIDGSRYLMDEDGKMYSEDAGDLDPVLVEKDEDGLYKMPNGDRVFIDEESTIYSQDAGELDPVLVQDNLEENQAGAVDMNMYSYQDEAAYPEYIILPKNGEQGSYLTSQQKQNIKKRLAKKRAAARKKAAQAPELLSSVAGS